MAGKLKGKKESEDDRMHTVNAVLKYGGGGALLFIIAAMAIEIFNSVTQVQLVRYLDLASPEELQKVFFGGVPTVVMCIDSPKALGKNEMIRPSFLAAAKAFTEKKWISFAVFSCNNQLPSGNTVYERFKLNTAKHPTMFLNMGGDKPMQLEPSTLKKIKSKKKNEPALVGHINKLIQSRYRTLQLSQLSKLRTDCIDRKACVLIVGNKVGEQYVNKYVTESLQHKYSLIRWRYLDTSKYETNIQLLLPLKSPAFVYFSKGKYRVLNDPTVVDQFLREIDETKLVALEKIPTMSKKTFTKKKKTDKEKQQMSPDELREQDAQRDCDRQDEMDKEASEIFDYEDEIDEESDEEEILL